MSQTYNYSTAIPRFIALGPFKCYVTQIDGGGGVNYSEKKKRYAGVRFNVISVTRGWVGVQFPEEKKRYVTLEWPHSSLNTLLYAISIQIYNYTIADMCIMMCRMI